MFLATFIEASGLSSELFVFAKLGSFLATLNVVSGLVGSWSGLSGSCSGLSSELFVSAKLDLRSFLADNLFCKLFLATFNDGLSPSELAFKKGLPGKRDLVLLAFGVFGLFTDDARLDLPCTIFGVALLREFALLRGLRPASYLLNMFGV